MENIPRAGTRWRWAKGDAVIRVMNPHDYPLRVGDIEIPPGESVLELHSDQAATMVEGDPRPLGFAAYGIELRVLEDKTDSPR